MSQTNKRSIGKIINAIKWENTIRGRVAGENLQSALSPDKAVGDSLSLDHPTKFTKEKINAKQTHL